jgi:hypothetical protein
MSEKYDVFISYSHGDREWVGQFVNALSEQKLHVWYDATEIKPGDPWLDRIEEGLRESTSVVFVITPETVHSNWFAAEMGAALALRKLVIPVLAKDTPLEAVPGPIKRRKYLLRDDPKTVAEEIARRVVSERNGEDEPISTKV